MYEEVLGEKFGSLTVNNLYRKTADSGYKSWMAKCKCDCGATGNVYVRSLITNKTFGCSRFKNKTIINNDYVEVYSHGGQILIVDLEDYDIVDGIKTSISSSGYFRVELWNKNRPGVHLLVAERMFSNIDFIDHIDRDKSNCRRSNLRNCSRAENNRNSKKKNPLTASSKYKGVYWSRKDKMFISQICTDNKRKRLGYFKNEIEAAKAYDSVALIDHKEFACTNKMLGLL